MKELTFQEVITNIKEEEVWESEYVIIKKLHGDIIIKLKDNNTTTNVMYLEKNDKFKLQRKEYSFQEAFKAYEEGKEIESKENGNRYVKLDGKDKYYSLVYKDWIPDNFGFSARIVRGAWYIND